MKIYSSYGHKTSSSRSDGWVMRYVASSCSTKRSLGLHHPLRRQGGIEYLDSEPEESWRVSCIETGIDSETGTRVRLAAAHLGSGPVMVTYGDGVGSIDVDALLAFHRAKGKLATVTAVQPPSRFGELVVDRDGLAREFAEKPQTSAGTINGGFMVFEREAIERYFPSDFDCMLEKEPLTAWPRTASSPPTSTGDSGSASTRTRADVARRPVGERRSAVADLGVTHEALARLSSVRDARITPTSTCARTPDHDHYQLVRLPPDCRARDRNGLRTRRARGEMFGFGSLGGEWEDPVLTPAQQLAGLALTPSGRGAGSSPPREPSSAGVMRPISGVPKTSASPCRSPPSRRRRRARVLRRRGGRRHLHVRLGRLLRIRVGFGPEPAHCGHGHASRRRRVLDAGGGWRGLAFGGAPFCGSGAEVRLTSPPFPLPAHRRAAVTGWPRERRRAHVR